MHADLRLVIGKVFKGMGGAMDLVGNPDATKIVVLTDHVDKYGTPKIVEHCTLPLTGAKVVTTIITDLVSCIQSPTWTPKLTSNSVSLRSTEREAVLP